MELNDLVKKLENLKKPEIEIPGHKEKLRRFLLSRYQKRQTENGFNILWKAMPVGLSLMAITALLLNNFLFPRLNIALAKEIAFQDQNVKSLIEKGAIVKEVKLSDSRGFLLLQISAPEEKQQLQGKAVALSVSAERTAARGGSSPQPQASAFLIEVDLKGRKIAKIEEKILTQSPLQEMEIVRAKEIMEENQQIKQAIKEGAQVEEIKKAFPQTQLAKKGIGPEITIEVLPVEETLIFYKQDAGVWRGIVDLQAGDIKTIDFFEIND
ncbi:MAG: hypothetical protein Q8N56_00025 [bacterium]|nr:hypothetical protein [bacterium]